MAEKEYIEREALSQAILDLPPKMDEQGYGWLGRRGVWQMVNDFPAADAQPVVLCKDCKHKGWVQEPEHGKSVDYCRLIERCVDKQFFCAAGERKPTA